MRGSGCHELIELGCVRGSYGVRGWVRVAPHSPAAEVLSATRHWWLLSDGAPRALDVTGVRRQGSGLVAKWDGCETPEAADALIGSAVAVARGDFPPLRSGEYYWIDLIGLQVINRAQTRLGRVKGLRASGAHDLLEIEQAGAGDSQMREVPDILVPMVDQYIDGVDLEAGTIRVNWELEWLA